MEEDIDIYADLPSITADKNNQSCNCEDIKRELNLLRSALENIQKVKENLENNMFSLLKTAKAEITRKDNMINDLRKRLDDVAFRRNNKGESQTFSAYKQPHRTPAVAETYESVSYIHSYESENDKLNETELRRDKYKKIKSEKSVDQVSTVFGERLHKRIMKDEIGEKMVAALKPNPEINARETSNIVESNKENGSQLNVNKDNESNIAMKNSSSEIPYRNNSERRRMSEENNIHEYKRIKLEDDTNANGKSDYNFTVQYDLKESFAQNEMKDIPVKLEDRLDTVHSFRKEQDSFDERHRAISEHKDVRQGQSCTNGWRRRRSNSRDCDDRRRKSVDRYWSTSERSNSDYKESNYRYDSRGRSYSSSRTNHESGHHSRIRSSNTYRDRKYDDCKYDRRYKSERSRRDYDSRGDGETKRRSRERSNLRDSPRYISSSIEDGEIGKSYKNSKYEKHRIKEAEASVSDNKRSHHSAVAGADLQASSSRTVVNTVVNYSDGKDADQCEAKSKSGIKSESSMQSTSVNDLNNLEEGEILDSPEKTNNFEDLSNEGKIKEGKHVKMSPVEDQNEQPTSENKVINEKVSNRSNDINVCGPDHLPYQQNLADSTVEIVETIEQVHDSNTYDGIIETANNAKEGNDINSENDVQITKTDDLGIKDAADEQEEVHRPSDKDATEISKDNNFVADSVTCKIDEESSSAEIITKVKAVFHCDIESKDESEISTKRSERSARCNTGASHMCLSDHNYNQSPANENDFDANEKPPVIPGGRKTVSATIRTTEVEEEPVNEQSIDVKRTTSSLVKNRKDQGKGIVISRRRKAVMLSDSNASMTVLMNTDTKTSPTIGNCGDNDSVLKPRACKTSRASVKAACK